MNGVGGRFKPFARGHRATKRQRRPWQVRAGLLLLLLPLLAASGCKGEEPPPAEPLRLEFGIMSTEAEVLVFGRTASAAEEAGRGIISELQERAARISRYDAGSDISRINAAAGSAEGVLIDDSAARAIECAVRLWRETGGAFNPLVGSLVRLWRESAAADRLPTEEEISAALALLDVESIELRRTADGWRCRLPRKGMSLDLGGMGKGWAADEALAVWADAAKLRGVMVMIGGDGFAWNADDFARPWRIGVQDPRQPGRRTVYTTLTLRNRGVVTSGNYERWFEIGGRRYNHILDPRTGRPVESRVVSATVIAEDGATADGLATACIVLGEQGAMEMLSRLGAEGMLLIDEGGPLRPMMSGAMAGYLLESAR